jgi:hypothetical protein
MSTTSESVALSSLSANSKRVYHRLALWAVSTVGFSIQERKTMPSQELHTESQSDFNSLIDKCDVVILCGQGGFRADVPLPHEIATIKRLVKQFYNANVEKVSAFYFIYYINYHDIILTKENCCVVCIVVLCILLHSSGVEEMDWDETPVS